MFSSFFAFTENRDYDYLAMANLLQGKGNILSIGCGSFLHEAKMRKCIPDLPIWGIEPPPLQDPTHEPDRLLKCSFPRSHFGGRIPTGVEWKNYNVFLFFWPWEKVLENYLEQMNNKNSLPGYLFVYSGDANIHKFLSNGIVSTKYQETNTGVEFFRMFQFSLLS